MSDEFPHAAVGERLKQLREQLSVSGAELARQTGVSQASVWEVEAGRKKPPTRMLLGIAQLGHDVNYLLTGIPCHPQAATTGAVAEGSVHVRPLETEELRQLANVISSIPPLMSLILDGSGAAVLPVDDVRQQEFTRRLQRVYQSGDERTIETLEAVILALTSK